MIPQRRPGVEWREFGHDALLLDPATGEYLQINETGTLVWKQVDGRKTIGEIVLAVAEDFGDAETVLQPDVEAFIEELIEKRVLSTVEP